MEPSRSLRVRPAVLGSDSEPRSIIYACEAKEQRPSVSAQYHVSNCALVNKILGQMWNSLPHEEKEKYFRLSMEESRLHYERHPDWVPNNKKRKRS